MSSGERTKGREGCTIWAEYCLLTGPQLGPMEQPFLQLAELSRSPCEGFIKWLQIMHRCLRKRENNFGWKKRWGRWLHGFAPRGLETARAANLKRNGAKITMGCCKIWLESDWWSWTIGNGSKKKRINRLRWWRWCRGFRCRRTAARSRCRRPSSQSSWWLKRLLHGWTAAWPPTSSGGDGRSAPTWNSNQP